MRDLKRLSLFMFLLQFLVFNAGAQYRYIRIQENQNLRGYTRGSNGSEYLAVKGQLPAGTVIAVPTEVLERVRNRPGQYRHNYLNSSNQVLLSNQPFVHQIRVVSAPGMSAADLQRLNNSPSWLSLPTISGGNPLSADQVETLLATREPAEIMGPGPTPERPPETQAGTCHTGACDTPAAPPGPAVDPGVQDAAAAIEAAAGQSSFRAWAAYHQRLRQSAEYQEACVRHRNSPRHSSKSALRNKVFSDLLAGRTGMTNSQMGDVAMSLTAFGEARGISVGEMGMVMRVLQNRADRKYRSHRGNYNNSRSTSRLRQFLPRSEAQSLNSSNGLNSRSAVMVEALANSQFSVWNDRDPNLHAMLCTVPNLSASTSNPRNTDEHLARAFLLTQGFRSGRFTYGGALAQSNALYFSAGSTSFFRVTTGNSVTYTDPQGRRQTFTNFRHRIGVPR